MKVPEPVLSDPLERFNLLDDAMPVMLAYIDSEQRYRYHNRAFREWLGMKAADVNGRTMREVLGEMVYGEIAPRVALVLGGQSLRYERTQKGRGGRAERLFVHLVPRFAEGGCVGGMFAIIVNQARHGRAVGPASTPASAPKPAASAKSPAAAVDQAQSLYDESLDLELTGWENAADRIRSALKNNEFVLYGQLIRDLGNDSRRFYEIFVRMTEEEQNMMPPGAFLPLAEKHGMMIELDRWTVTNVLKTVAARRHADPLWEVTAYCIPLSRDSICDLDFPDFVRSQLQVHGVPGEGLRFQLRASDVQASHADAAHLVQELMRLDCWSVLAGFGHDKVDFDILKGLPVGFLKIDSSIVFRILRDETALGTLKTITRVAHTVGINTIAELVESEEQIKRLREVGVDYAQGLAIGTPVALKDIA